MNKTVLLNFTTEEMREWISRLGEKPFRAVQIRNWLYLGRTFMQMTNLPSSLREKLDEIATDQPVSIVQTKASDLDGTKKYLFGLKDGHCVEGVLMEYKYGHTLCISTQVGCAMGCRFCASTLEGRQRNLEAAEMLGQVISANALLQDSRINHIVLMGSGEPFDNYDEVVRFLRLANAADGLNIGIRHISLSTCGLVPEIIRFSREKLPVTLSLSLHAPSDDIRRKIMPIAMKYTIQDTLNACRSYFEQTGRRVIIEYALIRDVNSSAQCAQNLAELLKDGSYHVNLIPLNNVKERNLFAPDEKTCRTFLDILTQKGISATRRRKLGDDIDGACGQLRKKFLENTV